MEFIQETAVDADAGQAALAVTDDPAATVVELHGDIDRDVAEPLWDCVAAGYERGADVLVDLSNVTLIDCAALAVLVRAEHLGNRRGHRLCLVAPATVVRWTLAATGLETAFPIFGDLREAMRDQPVRRSLTDGLGRAVRSAKQEVGPCVASWPYWPQWGA